MPAQGGRPRARVRGLLRALFALGLITLVLTTSVGDSIYDQIQGKTQQLNGVNGQINCDQDQGPAAARPAGGARA